MCLAVPGEVVEFLDKNSALVDFMGVKKKVCFDLLENIQVGDFVIVHAGFAISKLNKEDFLATVGDFKELFPDL